MERIVVLKEKSDWSIFLSFRDLQMNIAVKNENGLFSFPIRKLDDMEIVGELAFEIVTALKTSDELFIASKSP
jgi:hypothetical protein